MARYRLNINGVDYVAPDLSTLQKWSDEGRVLASSWVWVDDTLDPIMAQDVSGLRFGGPRVNPDEPPPHQRPGYSPGGPAYSRNYYAPVANYLVLAIFSTICCCLPFGVVSIVYAAQVDGFVRSGNQDAALDASDKAKNWAIASIVCGLIASALYFFLVVGARGNRYFR